MEKVGAQLHTVQGTYDKAWSQLKEGRGNLISQAHKFKDLGVRTKKELSSQVTESAELEFEDDEAKSLVIEKPKAKKDKHSDSAVIPQTAFELSDD